MKSFAPSSVTHSWLPRTRSLALVVFAALAALAVGSAGRAQVGQDPAAPLVVGTKEAPPFAMKSADGTWTGLAIELWEELATAQGVEFEYRDLSLRALLDGLADGSVDVGAAALTMTAEREAKFDFSHPFYTSGLGIVVDPQRGGSWWDALGRFPIVGFLQLLGGLCLALVVSGLAVWLLERRANPEQFEPGWQGVASGFWWSAVTMTTVGYGDKSPTTLGGRTVALVWMFLSLFMIATFTAAVASTFTAAQLGSSIEGPEDLRRVRVGVVADSSAAVALDARRIQSVAVDSVEAGLAAVARGELMAFVHDAPILRYFVKEGGAGGGLAVLPEEFAIQQYAIALSRDSALREGLNQGLLAVLQSPSWGERVRRYVGD